MIRKKVRAFSFGLTDVNITECGKTVNRMDKDYTLTAKERADGVFGRTESACTG
jgi:hypothetical protein